MKRAVLFLTVGLLVLAACAKPAPSSPEPAPTQAPLPTYTPLPTQTAVPTQTPYPTYTSVPTATAMPPTPTPIPPTATPKPPEFQKLKATQVIEAFKAASLEAESARAMTKDDYGMAPMTAVEGIRFVIPSLCSDCGGRVLSFASQADLDLTREYYVSLGKASALFFSWTFAKDNILVQINGDLPEDKARLYEAALVKVD